MFKKIGVLFCNNFRFTGKLQRERELLYSLHLASPNVNILDNQGTFVQTNTPEQYY